MSRDGREDEPAEVPEAKRVEHAGLRALLARDAVHALNAGLLGMLCVAAVDFLATWITTTGPIAFGALWRLLLVELGLGAILYVPVVLMLVWFAGATRLLWFFARRETAWPGLFGATSPGAQFQSGAAWAWSGMLMLCTYLAISTMVTLKLLAMFKEPQLTALLAATVQVAVIGVVFAVGVGCARGLRALGRRVDARLGRCNPFGHYPAALIGILLVAIPAVRLLLSSMPQLAPLVPWRQIISLGALGLGSYLYKVHVARRRLWPAERVRRRWTLAGCAAGVAILVPLVLLRVGAHPDTKAMIVASSPTLSSTMDLIRRANDFDGDGFGSLLGENDCGPFDKKVHPLARDIPDNGVDENCDGEDFALGKLPSYRTGERMDVPPGYAKDWNILFLTVDTVRYDHTGFGGYDRGTTPRLDELVQRSVSFSFANAPSAGTMASVPAILTSKFFHSGIALDEDVQRGMPPKLKPENTLISEVMKSAGYTTAAILTHEYFNDWGMDQGFDHYDNELGKTHNPRGITSDKLTDRAITWIGKQNHKKWFLWLHYLDPHGRYVSHPGGPDYGQSEMDLYDGELHFTDKHLGRLLDYLAHSPAGRKTIIVLTSDHGDAFNEHGFINHGQDLYRELLHVPLVVYVPNIEPRVVDGPVSPIDLFPTLADLASADIDHLAIEGESLVPQLFYGKDARDRVVFSETNWPKPLRAAISDRYKLIHDIKANVSRLFDLHNDPSEKTNIWTKDQKVYKQMKGYLNEWLERVYYARDAESNQAMAKLQKHLVANVPETALRVQGVTVESEGIEVVAVESTSAPLVAGQTAQLFVYLRTSRKPETDLKLQLVLWPEGDAKPDKATSGLRLTGDGLFASSRWRAGETVLDEFKILIPKSWATSTPRPIHLGIRFVAPTGPAPSVTGPKQPGSTDVTRLGSFLLSEASTDAEPKPPVPTPGRQR